MIRKDNNPIPDLTIGNKKIIKVYKDNKCYYKKHQTFFPQWFKDSCLFYYDIAVLNPTNESLAANPVLKDFSGSGRDMSLIGFSFNGTDSGISDAYPDTLVFDGVDDYGTLLMPDVVLTDFTVFMKADWRRSNTDNILSIGKSSPVDGCSVIANRTFNFYDNPVRGDNYHYVNSFGVNTRFSNDLYSELYNEGEVQILTPTSVNGHSIPRGKSEDSTEYPVNIGCHCMGSKRADINFHKALLFNRTLTDEEQRWVLENIFKRLT